MVEKLSFSKGQRLRALFIIANIMFFILIGIIVLVPLWKVIADSFDEKASLIQFRMLPADFTLDAYKMILEQDRLYRPFLISVATTVIGTLCSLTVTTLFAYGLSQKELLGKKIFLTYVLVTMVFRAGIIPIYTAVSKLGLVDTLISVVVIILVDAYYLILMKNFFSTIPVDIIDAAEIDGCSPLRVFMQIILPLSKAGLAAIGLFIVVNYWNMFFEYLMFINDTKLYNFQVKVRELVLNADTAGMEQTEFSTQTLRNSVVVLTIVPVLILYPIVQKYFVTGVNLGAVKE
ncbi:MAG: carbohydrate ABC transporter permease [Spirochaetales bacterium]|nr:carbohydrate ABC transporter permease [Spirochaetales bacterium]